MHSRLHVLSIYTFDRHVVEASLAHRVGEQQTLLACRFFGLMQIRLQHLALLVIIDGVGAKSYFEIGLFGYGF